MVKDIVLSLSNLHKSFIQGKNKLDILTGANLEIKKGEIVALIGPSGSGKSTLLYTAGLLDNFDSGEIIIDNKSCKKLNDNTKTKLRLNKIGFVYQQHNLFADFTAIENVMLPMLINGKSKKDAYADAYKKLELIGLSHRINHKPAELSGGEQQRVAIARALANNPMLLLADEPTGNLDPYNSEMVFSSLLDLVRKQNMTAFVATHNPLLASKMDRQIALVEGKLYDMKKAEDKKFLKSNAIGKKILESF